MARRARYPYRGTLTERTLRRVLEARPNDVIHVELGFEALAELLDDMDVKHYLDYLIGPPLHHSEGKACSLRPNPAVPSGQVWLEVAS